MSDGSDRVIEELKRMNVKMNMEDLFGDILDDSAKKYLLWYYSNFPTNQHRKNMSEIHATLSRTRIKSNIEMTSLFNQSNLKEIYSSTKEVMNRFISHSSFKNSPNKKSFLPKIENKK